MDNAFNSPAQVLEANMKAAFAEVHTAGNHGGGIYRIWRGVEQRGST